MTVYAKLKKFYKQNGLCLDKDLREYFRSGYVFSGPEYIFIGRRVGDGWFIRAAIGSGCFKIWTSIMPYHLPYIGWARCAKGRYNVKWHKTEKILRILSYAKHTDIFPGTSELDSQQLHNTASSKL